MKKYKHILEIVLLGALIIFCAISIAPKTFVMPSSLQMALLVIVIGLIAAFLVYIWRESPVDEREAHNQSLASRAAYIVGASVLLIALLVQGLLHELDPAIPIALLAMISTKLFLQRYKDDV